MYTAEYTGINSFLVGASALLLENGVKRTTRGCTCWELPEPFIFKITDPSARWITLPERKWNIVLPYAESLWLANGRNDLALIGHYLKNMKNFSDDGSHLRGGYGPRLRKFNGLRTDYTSNKFQKSLDVHEIDQFLYVEKSFQRDPNTRQAVINIGDPLKDCFKFDMKIKETKDSPCTRILQFMKQPNKNKLDLTVYMRSNDILWGASAVNIFNYTFMQEYFAKILNFEIGNYYHIVNNFHYYDEFRSNIESFANSKSKDEGFIYPKSFTNLEEFDSLLALLSDREDRLRAGDKNLDINLNDDFFNDWLKVLYHFNTKNKVQFINPILNELYD